MAFKTPEWTKNSNIYEVNIRQFTKGGNFIGLQHHLKRLKEMGVDIIWLMPIFPIGEKNRKGSLGSAYSIKDYKAINPDFGTFDDFDKTVKEIHKLGMHVILDWVANHTAWDNPWITQAPYRYHRDDQGNILAPNDDWTDVAHLDYSNAETVNAMIDAMSFWVKKFDIDGFRCDMAGLVPNHFWVEARRQLDKLKPLFWLAEWEDPKIHEAFDMSYCWEMHNLMKAIYKKEKNVYDFDHYRNYELFNFEPEAYRMTFTSNHDESAWNGTEYDRFGDGAKTFAAMTYCIPGMPLIYSGQEAAFNQSLPLFEKIEIDWKDYPLESFYRRLNYLKKQTPALWNGVYGGSYTKIMTTDNCRVFAFARVKGSSKVVSFFNLSPDQVDFIAESEVMSGNFENYFANAPGSLDSREHFILRPWEFKIYVSI